MWKLFSLGWGYKMSIFFVSRTKRNKSRISQSNYSESSSQKWQQNKTIAMITTLQKKLIKFIRKIIYSTSIIYNNTTMNFKIRYRKLITDIKYISNYYCCVNKNWNKNNIFKDFFWSSSEGRLAFSCFEGPYHEPKEVNTDHQLDRFCWFKTLKNFKTGVYMGKENRANDKEMKFYQYFYWNQNLKCKICFLNN